MILFGDTLSQFLDRNVSYYVMAPAGTPDGATVTVSQVGFAKSRTAVPGCQCPWGPPEAFHLAQNLLAALSTPGWLTPYDFPGA